MHWGNGWHYVTFPEIEFIKFNDSFSKAVIRFRSRWNGGGEAKYENKNSNWIRVKYNPVAWVE